MARAVEWGIDSVFGWRDARSETGWLSGIVIERRPCCLRVRDIRAGKLVAVGEV